MMRIILAPALVRPKKKSQPADARLGILPVNVRSDR